MSVTKQTTIWCDQDKCIEWYAADTGSAQDARHEAHSALGWRFINHKDLCFYHVPKPKL